ncbi:hypothetical protein M501DRAFT_1020269 [Patellaria atrata CBS 101060]|uniref:Uncharacterized protein n=1 Tax=Patellaria atrata CBS 101060 TaxID=1346257 RepID=A0A9P4S2P3_9PEZI|nr:hypothetical protein M501DRAFT_1020269 [Patellaria atrata CBS 101060]
MAGPVPVRVPRQFYPIFFNESTIALPESETTSAVSTTETLLETTTTLATEILSEITTAAQTETFTETPASAEQATGTAIDIIPLEPTVILSTKSPITFEDPQGNPVGTVPGSVVSLTEYITQTPPAPTSAPAPTTEESDSYTTYTPVPESTYDAAASSVIPSSSNLNGVTSDSPTQSTGASFSFDPEPTPTPRTMTDFFSGAPEETTAETPIETPIPTSAELPASSFEEPTIPATTEPVISSPLPESSSTPAEAAPSTPVETFATFPADSAIAPTTEIPVPTSALEAPPSDSSVEAPLPTAALSSLPLPSIIIVSSTVFQTQTVYSELPSEAPSSLASDVPSVRTSSAVDSEVPTSPLGVVYLTTTMYTTVTPIADSEPAPTSAPVQSPAPSPELSASPEPSQSASPEPAPEQSPPASASPEPAPEQPTPSTPLATVPVSAPVEEPTPTSDVPGITIVPIDPDERTVTVTITEMVPEATATVTERVTVTVRA